MSDNPIEQSGEGGEPIEFNFNQQVVVRLTELGKSVLNEYLQGINEYLQSIGIRMEDTALRPDNEGNLEISLWQLGMIFHKYLHMGNDVVFVDNNLEIYTPGSKNHVCLKINQPVLVFVKAIKKWIEFPLWKVMNYYGNELGSRDPDKIRIGMSFKIEKKI